MKPIQYQKGFVEWYKLKLKVTPDVLIPRPETELLVDHIVDFVNSLTPNEQTRLRSNEITILDIGTGSGNIAIALAKNLSADLACRQTGRQDLASHLEGGNVKIIATDVSRKALEVALQNAKLHGVEDRITFLESNLLENPSILNTLYSILIIVTNLPYIPTSRISSLNSSVKDFEPHIALDGGDNGFKLYEKLFIQIKEKNLNPDFLIGEIDYTQGEIAALIAGKYFPDMEIKVKKDLAHMQRFLSISKTLR